MATHNSAKLPGYLGAEKPAVRVGVRAGMPQNYAVAGQTKFIYSGAIVVAGLVACWAASMMISAAEIVAIAQVWPAGLDESGPNLTGKVALRVAGCLGLMVGGYVAAWFASRVQRSELNHAVVVGCIYGVLGVLSHEGPPMSLMLACVIFLLAVLSASLGGWLREAQIRRQQAILVSSRLK